MQPKKLYSEHSSIDTIYHISDIHIRNVKRHDEYREVLSSFLKKVSESGTENSLIVIAGDIAHSKVETSPELFREVSWFLKSCSELTDTVIILGNHDLNLSNISRLDVISPIVDSLNSEHIHFLREPGLYQCKNVLFSNYSIISGKDEWVTFDNVPSKATSTSNVNIALYHGPVNNSASDSGFLIEGKTVSISDFDGFDIAILGDIHKYQELQKYDKSKQLPAIVYSSSALQQEHGESLEGHGFCIWDLKTRTHTFEKLDNQYGYYQVSVEFGKLISNIDNIPKKVRLRVDSLESDMSDIQRIVRDIRTKTDVLEISYNKENSTDKQKATSRINLENVNDVTFQNKLISEHIRTNNSLVTQELLDEILKINVECNSKLTKDDKIPNFKWTLKSFKFDNMFSYGEGNQIDFTKLNGIVGLFGDNATGKSSIGDALCFVLFDKCCRTSKAECVMNRKKMDFYGEVNFEIDSIDYFVNRIGKRDKKGKVKVETNFYKIIEGKNISLNDEQRRSTNDVIRTYIGTYEDFMLTALSVQKNNQKIPINFADMGQAERKDFISKFLGSTIFDKLHEISNLKLNDLSREFKKIKLDDVHENIKSLKNISEIETKRYDEFLVNIKKLEETKDALTNKIFELNGTLLPVDASVITDPSSYETQLSTKKSKLSTYNFDELKNEIKTSEDKRKSLSEKLKEFDSSDIEIKKEKLSELQLELNEIVSQIELDKLTVKNHVQKVKHLENHEYDPNCQYCSKNIFVQDAIKSKSELDSLKPIVAERISKKKELESSIDELKPILETDKKFSELTKSISDLDSKILKSKSALSSKESEKVQLESQINDIESKLKMYKKNEESIQSNKKVKLKISEEKLDLSKLETNISKLRSESVTIITTIKVNEAEISNQEKIIKSASELEQKVKAYELYTKSVSRDGVPYEIICNTLPAIETEINNILCQVVAFDMLVSTDGKNINLDIRYEHAEWPVELGSGMETFISNLAIRIALASCSNMPKPQFLIIDEGFGTCDHEHLHTVSNLFEFLKTKFAFVIVVSHVGVMRDMVNNHLEFSHDDGFSKVIN